LDDIAREYCNFTTATAVDQLRTVGHTQPKGSCGTTKWDSLGLVPMTFRSQASSSGSQGGMLTNSSSPSGILQNYNKGLTNPSATGTSCHPVLMRKNYSDTRKDQYRLLAEAIGLSFMVCITVPSTPSFPLPNCCMMFCKLQ